VKSEFEHYTTVFKNRIVERIKQLTPETLPENLYEPVRYSLQTGGKLLRPILMLITCEAVCGSVENALDAACALEMVHNFSLVHDDIMDNDELRRGRETVHKKWNTSIAILAGDAILVKAYDALRQVKPIFLPQVLEKFNRGILKVCEGQTLDLDFEQRTDVIVEEYFYMIDRKTGKLFSLACELGAILGGGSEEQVAAMRAFGSRIGRAFQVQDDVLDFTADEAVLGKDVGSDLQEDKKTFLMLYAREHADASQKEQLQALRQNPHLSGKDIQEAISLLTEIGAMEAARREIETALDEAQRSLAVLPIEKPRTALAELVDYIRNREF
jgi:geranylgeranyl pyrophosphate synthase